jgi:hypothetical protein
MAKIKGASRWKIGERVATPNGFIAEIVSLGDEKALIRYLTDPPGQGETELHSDYYDPRRRRT